MNLFIGLFLVLCGVLFADQSHNEIKLFLIESFCMLNETWFSIYTSVKEYS